MTIAEHQARVNALLEICDQRHRSMGGTGAVDCNQYLSPTELQQMLESMRVLTTEKAPIPV